MADPPGADKRGTASGPERRRYDSPLRRQRASETRRRILDAGSALAHAFPTWDWRGLTVGAVAERAGVNKTTVYRHFPTERDLHDAIMLRLEDEAGISYEGLELENLNALVERAFGHLSAFAARPEIDENPADHPGYVADQRRRDALLQAVIPATTGWSDAERRMATAILDLLWSRTSHERLTEVWKLDADQATQAVTWGISFLVNTIRDGRRPGSEPPGTG
ncbi:MAG: TetR/AcrR family transcriptional regulator [Frankia sp.]